MLPRERQAGCFEHRKSHISTSHWLIGQGLYRAGKFASCAANEYKCTWIPPAWLGPDVLAQTLQACVQDV